MNGPHLWLSLNSERSQGGGIFKLKLKGVVSVVCCRVSCCTISSGAVVLLKGEVKLIIQKKSVHVLHWLSHESEPADFRHENNKGAGQVAHTDCLSHN